METVSANAPTIHERKASTGDNDRWSTRSAVIAVTLSSVGLWAAIWWAAISLASR